MADPFTWVMAAGAILGAVGQMSAASAQRKQAEQAAMLKAYEAEQMRSAAGQEQAAAQRRALEERRRAQLVASRALAVSAASGAGASDPTIEKIISDIAGEGEYRAGIAAFQGEERARRLQMGAEGALYEGASIRDYGESRYTAGMLSGVGSATSVFSNKGVREGITSLFDKYGWGGPDARFELGSDPREFSPYG